MIDLMAYMYDRLVEELESEGKRNDVIKACLPEWYHQYKEEEKNGKKGKTGI